MTAIGHSPDRTLVDAALVFAAKGWPVFPCHHETKKPLTQHGFHDASVDANVIEGWWRRWPNAMIGAPTGEAMDAWVLDVDDPALFEATSDIHLLSTRRCGTGKGYHLYFSWNADAPVRNSQLKMKRGEQVWPFPDLPGCDVRGAGGYVILPPSRHPSGKLYTWQNASEACEAPDDLLAIVRKLPVAGTLAAGPRAAEAPMSAISRGDGDHPYALSALRAECANIRSAGAGAQEGTLNDAALKIGGFVGGKCLEMDTAAGALIAAGLAMASHNPSQPWTADGIAMKVQRGLAKGMKNPRAVPPSAAPVRRKSANDDDGEKITPAEASEDMLALAFTAQHGDDLKFDHDEGKWYRWIDNRWQVDRKALAFEYARRICRELGDGNRSVGRAATSAGVEKFARGAEEHAVNSEIWNADPLLLGTPNGVVDLRKGVMSKPDKGLFISKCTSVIPARGEPAVWLQFLNEATLGNDELIRFLQQWCGYSLTGDTREQALIFIHGDGGNGKGVFLNTIKRVMGDYAVTAGMETFTANKFSGHPTELAMLRGARLVTASETEEGKAWAAARIKALTGGDPITARFMAKDFFTYQPEFKLLIVGNDAPSLITVDDAMRRRVNIVRFDNKPKTKDLQLEEKLRAEYPQILAWCIRGCRDWQANGLIRPTIVQEATTEYFSAQDLLGQWLDERTVQTPGRLDTCANFYANWASWIGSQGEDVPSKKLFGAAMSKRGFKSKSMRLSGIPAKVYQNIALLPPETNHGD